MDVFWVLIFCTLNKCWSITLYGKPSKLNFVRSQHEILLDARPELRCHMKVTYMSNLGRVFLRSPQPTFTCSPEQCVKYVQSSQ